MMVAMPTEEKIIPEVREASSTDTPISMTCTVSSGSRIMTEKVVTAIMASSAMNGLLADACLISSRTLERAAERLKLCSLTKKVAMSADTSTIRAENDDAAGSSCGRHDPESISGFGLRRVRGYERNGSRHEAR